MSNSIKAKICARHSDSDSMFLKRRSNSALTMERRKQSVIRCDIEAHDFSRVRLHKINSNRMEMVVKKEKKIYMKNGLGQYWNAYIREVK